MIVYGGDDVRIAAHDEESTFNEYVITSLLVKVYQVIL